MSEKKPTKQALLEARRAELGRCRAMTEKETECGNWGIDRVNDKAYCGQHLASIYLKEYEAQRRAAKREALNVEIDRFIAWQATYPAPGERMPADWVAPAVPPTEASRSVNVEPPRGVEPRGNPYEGPPAPRPGARVVWRASSGLPLTR